jgi:hypothetical protein
MPDQTTRRDYLLDREHTRRFEQIGNRDLPRVLPELWSKVWTELWTNLWIRAAARIRATKRVPSALTHMAHACHQSTHPIAAVTRSRRKPGKHAGTRCRYCLYIQYRDRVISSLALPDFSRSTRKFCKEISMTVEFSRWQRNPARTGRCTQVAVTPRQPCEVALRA